MKKYMLLCAALCIMMITAPLLAVDYVQIKGAVPQKESAQTRENGTIQVMQHESGFIKKIDLREYVIGALAGEMPAAYHTEALKAQAVAVYTFAKYVSQRDAEKLGGADITDESAVYQSYLDVQQRKAKWKDAFEENERRIEAAADAVLYKCIVYQDAPIMAAYFDMCSGTTESAAHIWGEALPYLVSVPSDGDLLSPNLKSETVITAEKMKAALQKAGVSVSEDPAAWFGAAKRYDSGVVSSIAVGKTTISGTKLREILHLKSADFQIEYDEKSGFRFTCSGCGHFVGMSQYGADYMARQGSTYREILMHYYPGTQIVMIK